MHPGIVLDLSDKGPVRFAFVHLAACATVDGKSLDPAVLQPFGELHDDLALVVPTQAGLDSDRFPDSLDDASCDHHHLVGLFHHAGPGSSCSDLAHGAAEIDVYQVAAVSTYYLLGVVGHPGRFDHGVWVASIDLDTYRGLLVRSLEFGVSLLGIADQPFGGNELGVDHVCSLLTADPPEGCVRHILHRCQQHRSFS